MWLYGVRPKSNYSRCLLFRESLQHTKCAEHDLPCYALATHPPSFNTRVVDAGLFLSADAGRIGLGTKFPEQLGQIWLSTLSAHSTQNVHSKVQITASVDSGGKSLSQHSQFGLSSSMVFSPF